MNYIFDLTFASKVIYGFGFGFYCLNVLVGIIAQLKLYHFGKAHHYLYFIVFSLAILAFLFTFKPVLVITLLSLAILPKSRPWTYKHPLLGVLGLLGYCLGFLY